MKLFGRDRANLTVLWANISHSNEHYGNVVTYVRLKGVVPPSSEGGALRSRPEQRQSLAVTGVNDLVEPFGMKLTPDTPYVHNCSAIAKAGEIHRADREIP